MEVLLLERGKNAFVYIRMPPAQCIKKRSTYSLIYRAPSTGLKKHNATTQLFVIRVGPTDLLDIEGRIICDNVLEELDDVKFNVPKRKH